MQTQEGHGQVSSAHLMQMLGVVEGPQHSDEQVRKADQEPDTNQRRDRDAIGEDTVNHLERACGS